MKRATKSAVKTALVLRSCNADMSSQNGFVWPGVGEVATASDWIANDECGAGLHGWLYGQGDHSCSSYLDETSKWLVVEVEEAGIIMLGGKCKFESGTVRFVGSRAAAAEFILANELRSATVAVIGATLACGENQSVIVGAFGTATAGDRGTATVGYRGTATAGYSGTATVGYRGTATAGYSGTATAGYSGTATAGNKGEIRIKYWDSSADRYRTKSGYIGEEGLEPDRAYRLDDNRNFVAA